MLKDLPTPRHRLTRRGPAVTTLSVLIEIVTPILGGGSQTRSLDEVEIIRAATVRGQFRFWWRTLYSHQFPTPKELYAGEGGLWGHAATEKGGRSAIDLRIDVDSTHLGKPDSSNVRPATPDAYALWPARAESSTNAAAAPRRLPGTRFRLTLVVPTAHEAEVRNVVRAWLLFGGYGSRSRRGLGSFKVVDDPAAWLPKGATREAIKALFGSDIFGSAGKPLVDVPWLAGAGLHVGPPVADATKAWLTALEWLREFRQGYNGPPGGRAREPGGAIQPQRPSISNWPEPDKIRRLKGKLTAHPPRHNATPAWPRAGFGLPILGRFQAKSRNGGHLDEPDHFELRWRSATVSEPDRLASPLIVKALPLAGGMYVPCALWLGRAYPAGGEVGLARPGAKQVDSKTVAPFDRLVAPGEEPRFSALAGKQHLRDAFLDWLRTTQHTTVIAP